METPFGALCGSLATMGFGLVRGRSFLLASCPCWDGLGGHSCLETGGYLRGTVRVYSIYCQASLR